MNDKIAVACPGCTAGFKAPSKYAGKNVKCPKCETVFLVSVPEAEPELEPVLEVEGEPQIESSTTVVSDEDLAETIADSKPKPTFPSRKPTTQGRRNGHKQTRFQRRGSSGSPSSQRLARREGTSRLGRNRGDEEDEDDRGRYRQQKKKGGNIALWIGIAAGFLVLIVIAIVAISSSSNRNKNNPPNKTSTDKNPNNKTPGDKNKDKTDIWD